MNHDRLLVISVGGFIVNLIGIFAFHHGGLAPNIFMSFINFYHNNDYRGSP